MLSDTIKDLLTPKKVAALENTPPPPPPPSGDGKEQEDQEYLKFDFAKAKEIEVEPIFGRNVDIISEDSSKYVISPDVFRAFLDSLLFSTVGPADELLVISRINASKITFSIDDAGLVTVSGSSLTANSVDVAVGPLSGLNFPILGWMGRLLAKDILHSNATITVKPSAGSSFGLAPSTISLKANQKGGRFFIPATAITALLSMADTVSKPAANLVLNVNPTYEQVASDQTVLPIMFAPGALQLNFSGINSTLQLYPVAMTSRLVLRLKQMLKEDNLNAFGYAALDENWHINAPASAAGKTNS